ncbi:MAG: glycosyltransferase [Sphingobacteriia bacterium]|nr:glycosyltransferase [Sphingobacteriia bacterium]
MKLFVKLLINTFDNASRDKRELSVVRDLGYPIHIVAKGETNSIIQIDDWTVNCRTTRPLGQYYFLNKLNRVVSLFTWAIYVRKLNASVISCHDLIALLIGWMSTIFQKNRPLLVYDSHEFELGRNTKNRRSFLNKRLIVTLERFLIGKSRLSIMVNQSIASEVKNVYKLDTMPLVVRNIPTTWTVDYSIISAKRKYFCDKLGINQDTFLMMYHGSITTNRGIEQLLLATKEIPDCAIVILGFGIESYITSLKNLINSNSLDGKVIFHESVPLNVLWQYIGAADLGVMLDQNTCKSYYYSLPNKLFENIQAETAVLCSDFPEYRKIVIDYKIGLCCDSHDQTDIIQHIRQIKENPRLQAEFKKNLALAKQELCWENERKILVDAYTTIFNE